MADLTKKEIDKMIKLVKEVSDYVKIMNNRKHIKVGPQALRMLKGLEVALKTGKKIGDALEETRKQLKLVEDEIYAACGFVSKEAKNQRIKGSELNKSMVCQSRVFRKFQARAVKLTLDPNVSDGMFEQLSKKHVAELKKYQKEFILWIKKAGN